jgi:hypothetical protein
MMNFALAMFATTKSHFHLALQGYLNRFCSCAFSPRNSLSPLMERLCLRSKSSRQTCLRIILSWMDIIFYVHTIYTRELLSPSELLLRKWSAMWIAWHNIKVATSDAISVMMYVPKRTSFFLPILNYLWKHSVECLRTKVMKTLN